ncbi:hypothetical protein ACFWWB_39530 [Streptomyces sp. NPDC058690]|uniref:hypothetical protein n=1 Tax=Streptomyces sp. NPDC058690 TaxID=3346600 RepID=UPI003663AF7A
MPTLDFTLHTHDLVETSIDGVGTMRNPLTDDRTALDWLAEAIDRPLAPRTHRAYAHGEQP